MQSIKYLFCSFLLVGLFANNSWSELLEERSPRIIEEAEIASGKTTTAKPVQPVEEAGPKWKYLVKRETALRDNLADKTEVHVDRALVHYGAGAKQAGGQKRGVPQVVYVDENLKRLQKAVYHESAIVPYDFKKFRLVSKLPNDAGSDPNFPVPIYGLPCVFDVFPLKSEAELKQGLTWTRTWYLCIGWETIYTFPATIKHEVKGYEQKQGRNCVVIEYTIAGEFKHIDNKRDLRGEYYLKGSGTAYFDPVDGIIVEKEQTISWTRFGEKLAWVEDGKVGWKPTADDKKTVKIRVLLQPEHGAQAAAAELIKPVAQESSKWKYFIERTITTRQNAKKKVCIDRAFVHFGAEAKQAGGQIKTVPHVVYIDENQHRLAKAIHHGPAITTLSSEMLTLTGDLPKAKDSDPNMGSDPNFPVQVATLVNSFFLPLEPKKKLEDGIRWSSILYACFGWSNKLRFPVAIKHELKGYEQKQGMRCAVIEYTIAGEFKFADHPERFKEDELRESKGEFSLKGNGKVHLKAGIIVQKEQTVSWKLLEERFRRLENSDVGWVPVVNQEQAVKVRVSLRPN